jgi:poly-gamma-glutamate capsule biosynthesis protein CapA/YwtB (metallophosphatase superfamily)
VRGLAALVVAGLLVTACSGGAAVDSTADAMAVETGSTSSVPSTGDRPGRGDKDPAPTGVVTLGFAGDVHFQLNLTALLDNPRGALGPIARTLAAADVTMVNLETAITSRGTLQPKEFRFRTTPAALDVLDQAGVDLVTMANNHAADYGPIGLSDALRAVRSGPIPAVGIGRDRDAAFRPYRVKVGDTDLAFLGADSSPRETPSRIWGAGPDWAGVAAARSPKTPALLRAVRAASERDDVVVVYLHWGREYERCPTVKQQRTARAVARAGADVIVGAHAHVLLGSGWLGKNYVSYGLGNFLWYHNHQPDTGVLELRVEDGEVVRDSWTPALIRTYGVPRLLAGRARAAAVEDWRRLPSCAGLAARPPVAP